jgi:vaccinia related kinase
MDLKEIFVNVINDYIKKNHELVDVKNRVLENFKFAFEQVFTSGSQNNGCKYIFKRGKNIGNVCGAGKKDLCGKHSKQNETEITVNNTENELLKKMKKMVIKPAAENKPIKQNKKTMMAKKIPTGTVVKNLSGDVWTLGPPIGKGGFGEIYSAYEGEGLPPLDPSGYASAIKIEPHDNGPLFVEMNFYLRVAKACDIEKFKIKKQLKTLGMPRHVGSGSHVHNGIKYRFLVMEKYGSDIWKLFVKNNKQFKAPVVLKLTIQTLHILEYIHSRGYVHADIKGANMLLKENDPSQIYLLDFGLSCHYDKEYKPNPKKAHNGTLEYVSRDGHCGIQSRRGDLEILGYNIIEWAGGILPWEHLKDPALVHKYKQKYMADIPQFFNCSFKSSLNEDMVETLTKFFNAIVNMSFEENPNYEYLEKIITSSNIYDNKITFQ